MLMRMISRIACMLLALFATSSIFAQETQRQYLSGKGIDDAVPWEFFCSAGHKSGQWSTLPVPSCWDAEGFGQLAYGRLPKGQEHPTEQGKYRHRFKVPADWSGQTILLVFEGSMTDTQAFINGQSAGPMASTPCMVSPRCWALLNPWCAPGWRRAGCEVSRAVVPAVLGGSDSTARRSR